MDEILDQAPVVVITTQGGSTLTARLLIHLRQAARDQWSVCIEPTDTNMRPKCGYTLASWSGFWASVDTLTDTQGKPVLATDLPLYSGRARPTPDGWGSGILHKNVYDSPFTLPDIPEAV